MQKWEYLATTVAAATAIGGQKGLDRYLEGVEEECDRLGLEGWEMVTSYVSSGMTTQWKKAGVEFTGAVVTILFKRPLVDDGIPEPTSPADSEH